MKYQRLLLLALGGIIVIVASAANAAQPVATTPPAITGSTQASAGHLVYSHERQPAS